jgi:hypothetical protein
MDEAIDPRNPAGIRVGDVYEDCSFHPVLCIKRDLEGYVRRRKAELSAAARETE